MALISNELCKFPAWVFKISCESLAVASPRQVRLEPDMNALNHPANRPCLFVGKPDVPVSFQPMMSQGRPF